MDSILALKLIGRSKLLTSAEFVEVSPKLDINGKTAKAVISLVEALWGNVG